MVSIQQVAFTFESFATIFSVAVLVLVLCGSSSLPILFSTV